MAWAPLGWQAAGFAEIEPFPCAVLAHHFPDVRNYGDFTKWREWNVERGTVDLVCGGTPCQSFSVAGLRKGMDDARGNLSLEFLKFVGAVRPRWVVWENVPGVLSSNRGRDFGSILGGLGELGYGWAYRILDAQYVRVDGFERAVPQRRRRVFVVGYLGDWQCAAAVLFERDCLCGNSAPIRETRESSAGETAPCLRANGVGVSRSGDGRGQDPVVCDCRLPIDDCRLKSVTGVGVAGGDVGYALRANASASGDKGDGGVNCSFAVHRMRAFDDYVEDGVSSTIKSRDYKDPTDLVSCYENHGQDCRVKEIKISPSISAKAGTGGNNLPLVQEKSFSIAENIINRKEGAGGNGTGAAEGVCYTLNASGVHGVSFNQSVRRLTPRECERLMGFPDDYTLIPWHGKAAELCPDAPRYKALGNSWAVNCARWIGRRIEILECSISNNEFPISNNE